jgi:DNA repair exonuclease SbcCD ATPase subunit
MFSQTDDLIFDNSLESETEALQTDIQRFIGIIAFCLMAIFALVQAIPLTTNEDEAAIESLNQTIERQIETLNRLQSENQALKSEIKIMRAAVTRFEDLEEQLDNAEKPLETLSKRVADLLSERLEERQNLAQLSRKLDERETRINRINREKDKIEKKLAEFVQKAEQTDALKEKIKGLKQLLTLKTTEPAKESEKQQKEEAVGLSVAFASDSALMDLLESGRIRLYIMVEIMEKAFRVISKRDAIDFVIEKPDGGFDYWRIGPSQIPKSIRDRFYQETTLAHKEKTFIVGLPAEISDPIRNTRETNGRFLIQGDGSIVFKNVGGVS